MIFSMTERGTEQCKRQGPLQQPRHNYWEKPVHENCNHLRIRAEEKLALFGWQLYLEIKEKQTSKKIPTHQKTTQQQTPPKAQTNNKKAPNQTRIA